MPATCRLRIYNKLPRIIERFPLFVEALRCTYTWWIMQRAIQIWPFWPSTPCRRPTALRKKWVISFAIVGNYLGLWVAWHILRGDYSGNSALGFMVMRLKCEVLSCPNKDEEKWFQSRPYKGANQVYITLIYNFRDHVTMFCSRSP